MDDIVDIIRSIHRKSERGRCTSCRGPFDTCLSIRAADEIEALRKQVPPWCSERSWNGDVCALPPGHANYHASVEGVVWSTDQPGGPLRLSVEAHP